MQNSDQYYQRKKVDDIDDDVVIQVNDFSDMVNKLKNSPSLNF